MAFVVDDSFRGLFRGKRFGKAERVYLEVPVFGGRNMACGRRQAKNDEGLSSPRVANRGKPKGPNMLRFKNLGKMVGLGRLMTWADEKSRKRDPSQLNMNMVVKSLTVWQNWSSYPVLAERLPM